jgi:hypothetical protein
MVDAGIRARVVRFLNGDFVPEDLARIFLFARDRCDGREPVQEIGALRRASENSRWRRQKS